MDEPKPHVASAPHAAGAKPSDVIVHWSRPIVPRHPDALEDTVENMLALVAACQSYESALAIWESALRRGLVTKPLLERLPFTAAGKTLLRDASAYSDSGLETFVLPRLRWLNVRIIPQVWVAGHRIDFLIGERLALQIDGGHHVGQQRTSDIEHDAELTLMGYHVIRVGYVQVIEDWPAVQERIQLAIAQGLHLAA